MEGFQKLYQLLQAKHRDIQNFKPDVISMSLYHQVVFGVNVTDELKCLLLNFVSACLFFNHLYPDI